MRWISDLQAQLRTDCGWRGMRRSQTTSAAVAARTSGSHSALSGRREAFETVRCRWKRADGDDILSSTRRGPKLLKKLYVMRRRKLCSAAIRSFFREPLHTSTMLCYCIDEYTVTGQSLVRASSSTRPSFFTKVPMSVSTTIHVHVLAP